MKLYYITDAKIPTEKAHGYQICKMCEEFGKRVELELIIPGRITHIKENLYDFYGLKKTFSVKVLGEFDFVKFERYIGGLTFYWQKVWFLYKLSKIGLEKNSLIYTRDIEVVWFLGKKFKVVYEGHNFSDRSYINKKILRRAYKIICITKGLKDEYIKVGFKSEDILVAPDGVDLDLFSNLPDKNILREELDIDKNKKVIMYVGSFYKWKGIDILIEVARMRPEYNFIIVGGGNIDDLPNNVILIGSKKHSEIPKWMKSADVLVLPNSGKEGISRFYTSPLKMFEYMASGVPIVASDLPSMREVLNEDMAVLVEPDEVEALEKGIKKIIENNNLAEMTAKKAKEEVEKYSWCNRADRILEFIKT